MNLQKLLAKNMVRFGTKNLNEQLRKILLAEKYSPGDTIPAAPNLTLTYNGAVKQKLMQALQKYTTDPKVLSAAIIAIGAGFAKQFPSGVSSELQKGDKGYKKKLNYPGSLDQYTQLDGPVTGVIGMLAWKSRPEMDDINPNVDVYGEKITLQFDQALVKAANFTYSVTSVPVYPIVFDPPSARFPLPAHKYTPGPYIATLGASGGGGVKDPGGSQSWTHYNNLIQYMNRFNLGNTIEGDFNQYDLSTMVDTNKHVDLLKTEVYADRIIVYTANSRVAAQAGKEINTSREGASEPIDKDYDVNFESRVDKIPAGDSEVKRAIADAIEMFPDGNITNLNIVSSASPEYNSISKAPGWEKSYPKGITGTTDPGNGTDDATRNMKLAYNRGVNFVAAINAGLLAQGYSPISDYTINWKISNTGGSLVPGRFASIEWSKAGDPGKATQKMNITSKEAEIIKGVETTTVYQHVFTFAQP